MDPQAQLFSLMNVAEEQQKAVQAAIGGLAAERQALAQERVAIHQIAQQAAQAAGQMHQAALQSVPAVQQAASQSVATSVASSMKDVSATAATALKKACQPVMESLSAEATKANEAAALLHSEAQVFSGKLILILLGFALAVVAALFAGAWGVVQYERSEVSSLSDEKARLQSEVAQLKAASDNWASKAGRALINTCGDSNRLCVHIDTRPGAFNDKNGGNLYIIQGY